MSSNALRQRLSLERVRLHRGQGVLCAPAAGRPPAGIRRVRRGWTQRAVHQEGTAGQAAMQVLLQEPEGCLQAAGGQERRASLRWPAEQGVKLASWAEAQASLMSGEQGCDGHVRETRFSLCTGIADTAAGLLLANYNSSLAEAGTWRWPGPVLPWQLPSPPTPAWP